MPETSSAVAEAPGASGTSAQTAATGAAPVEPQPEKRRSEGLSRIGEALSRFNSSEAEKSGRLPDDAAPDADEGDGAESEDGQEARAESQDGQAPDDQAPQVTQTMIAAAQRLGISERALRAMPADVRAEVLEAERRTTATISGLRGNLKQASMRGAKAGETSNTTQGAVEDERDHAEGSEPQQSGRGEEPEPETSETIKSRPRTPAKLPPKIDSKAIREKFVLQFGEEQADALMDVVNPLSQFIDSQHEQAEADRASTLEDMAQQAEKFVNSCNMPEVFGPSYENATKEQREARKKFAGIAYRGLNAGLYDNWPTALRKTLRAEYDRSDSRSAEERLRGKVVRRSQSVTPAPSRNAGGISPGSGKRNGLDAIQGVLNKIHLGDDD